MSSSQAIRNAACEGVECGTVNEDSSAPVELQRDSVADAVFNSGIDNGEDKEKGEDNEEEETGKDIEM